MVLEKDFFTAFGKDLCHPSFTCPTIRLPPSATRAILNPNVVTATPSFDAFSVAAKLDESEERCRRRKPISQSSIYCVAREEEAHLPFEQNVNHGTHNAPQWATLASASGTTMR